MAKQTTLTMSAERAITSSNHLVLSCRMSLIDDLPSGAHDVMTSATALRAERPRACDQQGPCASS